MWDLPYSLMYVIGKWMLSPCSPVGISSLCLILSDSCSGMQLVLGQLQQRVSLSRHLPANSFHSYELTGQWQKSLRWWTFPNLPSRDTPLLGSVHCGERSEVCQSASYHSMMESPGTACIAEPHLMWMQNLWIKVGYFKRERGSYFYFYSWPADINKTVLKTPGHTVILVMGNNELDDVQVIRQPFEGALCFPCIGPIQVT